MVWLCELIVVIFEGCRLFFLSSVKVIFVKVLVISLLVMVKLLSLLGFLL